MVDAEQTYYQPAIRHIAVDMLMPRYNMNRAVIYETNHLDDTHYPPPVLLRWKPQPVKLMLTTLSHHLRYIHDLHLIVCLLVVLTGRI